MSINTINDFTTKFISEVTYKFQEESVIPPSAYIRKMGKHNAFKFPIIGETDSYEHVRNSNLKREHSSRDPKTVTIKFYNAVDEIESTDLQQIAYDDRQVAVTNLRMAMGRRIDQVLIDALAASTTTNTVAKNVSGSDDDLTVASIQEAAKALDAIGVPASDRYAIIHTNGLHHILTDERVSSEDYNNVKALIRGDLETYYGFKFVKIGNRTVGGKKGGLPITNAGERTNFFFHKNSLACAMNTDLSVRIDYDTNSGNYLVLARVGLAATTLDDNGIVKVKTLES